MLLKSRLVSAIGTVLFLGAGAMFSACGSSTASPAPSPTSDAGTDATTSTHACIPGQQVACTCPGGATGAQVCTSDGNGFGVCTGCGSPDGSSATDAPATPTPDAASDANDVADASDAGATDAASDAACPPGLLCGVTCDAGTTTVTGTVYDPAGKNRVANVVVYVPATPLTPLTRGVDPVNACTCSALYPSGAITSTVTATDGTFTLRNVPAGAQVPLVLQIGKWRRKVPIAVTACTTNAQPDGSLALPGSIAAGDTDDSMPDIAVSTGGSDSLECLLYRMGVTKLEYVPGSTTTGHVHLFAGGSPGGGGMSGTAEKNPIPGAPASSVDGGLWDSKSDLMAYDLVLLSCEGGETYAANPAALEAYVNAGGRVFASHFHYAWFTGSAGQGYAAPSDWGSNLATWTLAGGGGPGAGAIGGIVDTTLNGTANPFPKGARFAEWLGDAGALGQNGVAAGELSIYSARFNATVGAANVHSQPWLVSDSTSGMPGYAMAFSFDTPVTAAPAAYCGRAIYSDLHVSGDPSETDTVNAAGGSPPPDGCVLTGLSAQEKALEYMLFDLSSCVVPDDSALPADAGAP